MKNQSVEPNATRGLMYIILFYIYIYIHRYYNNGHLRGKRSGFDAKQKCLNVQLGSRGAVFNRLKSSAYEGLIVRCLYIELEPVGSVVYAGVLSDPDNVLGIISRLQVRGRQYAYQPVTR